METNRCLASPPARLASLHSTPSLDTGGNRGRDMCPVKICPVQEGMDEQIPLAEGQERRLQAAREGRRNGGPSRGEDHLGGYRCEMMG